MDNIKNETAKTNPPVLSPEKLVICEHGYTFTVPVGARLTETEGYRDLPTGKGSGRFVHKCKLYDCELEFTVSPDSLKP